MDTVDYIRVRAYNWFGESLLPRGYLDLPFVGKNTLPSFWHTRDYADPRQHAVYSFELHNIRGLSEQIYWTKAIDGWVVAGVRAGTFSNLGTTAPIWKTKSYHPTNLQVVPINSVQAALTWTNPASATGADCAAYVRPYKSEGYPNAAAGWVSSGNTTSGGLTISGLSPNVRYEFVVDTGGLGGTNDAWLWSNIVQVRMPNSAPPAPSYPAPSGVSPAATGLTTMNVTWTPNGSPTNVEISRRNVTTGGSWSVVSATYSSAQPFADTGLTAGTTYAYKIRNNYSGNYSDYSAEGFGTTNSAAPPSHTPTNAQASALGYYSIVVTWTTNGGGSNHTVEYVQDQGPGVWTGSSTATGSSSPKTINGLLDGTTYRVRVRAMSPSTSDWSNEVTVTTNVYIPGGEGGGGCVVYETPVIVTDEAGRQSEVRADKVKRGDSVISISENGHIVIGKIKDVYIGRTTRLYTIVTENGAELTCSPSHPIIVEYGNVSEKAFRLKVGDTVMVYNKHHDQAEKSRILSCEFVDFETNVLIFEMENAEHTFVSGGIVSHNLDDK
jgi:hypothetical protein